MGKDGKESQIIFYRISLPLEQEKSELKIFIPHNNRACGRFDRRGVRAESHPNASGHHGNRNAACHGDADADRSRLLAYAPSAN